MVTAVDSNLFFDLVGMEERERQAAIEALQLAGLEGTVIISAVCYAELSYRFRSAIDLDAYLGHLEVSVSPIDQEIAFLAGRFHRDYKLRGGTRTRILADFLIAAHAQLRADRLLTRDKLFFGEHLTSMIAVHPQDL